MALYCYIVETGYYEDKEVNILGHETKYSQEEFDNICIEIIEKHGDVEEIEYTVQATLETVEEIRYKIDANDLISHLVYDYDFIELDLPSSDGVLSREISREPVPAENLRKVVVKPKHECPMESEISCNNSDNDFKDMKPLYVNARCVSFRRIENND